MACPQEEQAAQRKVEEQRLREEMMAKLAEEDKLEQMNAQRARMRRAEHLREVEQILADKRAISAAAEVWQTFTWESAQYAACLSLFFPAVGYVCLRYSA